MQITIKLLEKSGIIAKSGIKFITISFEVYWNENMVKKKEKKKEIKNTLCFERKNLSEELNGSTQLVTSVEKL